MNKLIDKWINEFDQQNLTVIHTNKKKNHVLIMFIFNKYE